MLASLAEAESPGAPALASPARWAAWIAACLASLASVSWVGALLAGRPGLDVTSAPMERRVWLTLAMCPGLCAAAWLHLRAHAARGGASWRALVAGAIAVHLAGAAALPLTSNDLFSNLAYGRLGALGANPYFEGPSSLPPDDPFAALVAVRWRSTPIVYGPIVAGLDTLIGRAGGVAVGLALQKLAMLACGLGVVAIAWRLCRQRLAREQAASTFALVAMSPLLAWEISAQAHNDGLLVVALAGAVWAGARGKQWLAAGLLACAVLVKHAAAPVLALHLWCVLRRAPLRGLAMAAAVAALGGLAVLPYWEGAGTLAAPLSAAGGDPSRSTRSVAYLVHDALGLLDPRLARASYFAIWGAGLALLGLLALRAAWRVRTFEDVAHHGLLILLAYDLVTPWFQAWYVVWLLPLALVERDGRLQRVVAIYAALSLLPYALQFEPYANVAVDATVVALLWRMWRAQAQKAPRAAGAARTGPG
jgi:hypothetical protein